MLNVRQTLSLLATVMAAQNEAPERIHAWPSLCLAKIAGQPAQGEAERLDSKAI
jgi:hypothetical protein